MSKPGYKDKVIVINEKGNVLCLYDDDLPDLGHKTILRASEVEADQDTWTVRLSAHPANGCFALMYLGEGDATVPAITDARHFSTRAEALAAEVKFIQKHILEGN
jgi:hypothetical protein